MVIIDAFSKRVRFIPTAWKGLTAAKTAEYLRTHIIREHGIPKVIITDRGEPSHVLLTFQDYRKLTETEANIADLLAHPQSADMAFDPPRLQGDWLRPADLS